MNPIFEASTEVLGGSAATEAAISAAQGATAAAGSATLLGVQPMGGDPTSIEFALAVVAAGGAYLASIAEHTGQRGLFAGAQGMMASTIEVTEQIRGATASIAAAL
jgi:hypothetical protein